MGEATAQYLATNVKQLRVARGLSQQQCAKIAGIPRPTWSHLESGESNPTLAVLLKVAVALRVSLEELIQPPKAEGVLYRAGSLPSKQRGGALIQPLLPETIVGIQMERLEFETGGGLTGVPHTPGSREYLVCNAGILELVAAGERWELRPGDLVVFRGDQKHSYQNLARRKTSAYSVIVLPSQRRYGEDHLS